MSERAVATVSKPAQCAVAAVSGPLLQRKCACGQHASGGECDECKKKSKTLQRSATNASEPKSVPPIVHDVLRSPGQPLDPVTRGVMESRFGRDFSPVRVHASGNAARSAQAVDALAYTVRNHIVFDQGQYAPMTADGNALIAHELTHVVQQSGDSESRDLSDLSVAAQNDVHEVEARRAANDVTASHSANLNVGAARVASRLLQRASRNEKAGGCGVCLDATQTGVQAHVRAQQLFLTAYRGLGVVAEAGFSIPINEADEENSRLDLLRIDRSRTPTVIEIGEIKPDNRKGRRHGKRDLQYYREQLQAVFKGPAFAVEFMDLAPPPGPAVMVESPSCPAQGLTLRGPKIGGAEGLYLYSCNPARSQVDKKCCGQTVPVPVPVPLAQDDKETDEEKAKKKKHKPHEFVHVDPRPIRVRPRLVPNLRIYERIIEKHLFEHPVRPPLLILAPQELYLPIRGYQRLRDVTKPLEPQITPDARLLRDLNAAILAGVAAGLVIAIVAAAAAPAIVVAAEVGTVAAATAAVASEGAVGAALATFLRSIAAAAPGLVFGIANVAEASEGRIEFKPSALRYQSVSIEQLSGYSFDDEVTVGGETLYVVGYAAGEPNKEEQTK